MMMTLMTGGGTVRSDSRHVRRGGGSGDGETRAEDPAVQPVSASARRLPQAVPSGAPT